MGTFLMWFQGDTFNVVQQLCRPEDPAPTEPAAGDFAGPGHAFNGPRVAQKESCLGAIPDGLNSDRRYGIL